VENKRLKKGKRKAAAWLCRKPVWLYTDKIDVLVEKG
jgi:hypothetical protein